MIVSVLFKKTTCTQTLPNPKMMIPARAFHVFLKKHGARKKIGTSAMGIKKLRLFSKKPKYTCYLRKL